MQAKNRSKPLSDMIGHKLVVFVFAWASLTDDCGENIGMESQVITIRWGVVLWDDLVPVELSFLGE